MSLKPKHNHYVTFLLLLLFVFTSCSVRIPGNIIPENKMEDVLYDYQIAKAMGDELSANEAYKRTLYVEYVFKKHKITQNDFDTSLQWYTRHTDILTKIYERVTERLTAQNEEINTLIGIRDNKPKTSLPGDSVDLWVWDKIYNLSSSPLTNRVTFTMPSDTNFHQRDSISWEVYYRYLDNQPDSAHAAIMSMVIQYENDSIISDIQNIYSSGLHTLGLQSDTLGNIKEIKGFIYYPMQRDSIRNLILTDVSLFRYHSRDSVDVSLSDSLSVDIIPSDSTSVINVDNEEGTTSEIVSETTVSQIVENANAVIDAAIQENQAVPTQERPRAVRRRTAVQE